LFVTPLQFINYSNEGERYCGEVIKGDRKNDKNKKDIK